MSVGLSARTNADAIIAALEAKGRKMDDVIRYAVNDTVDDMVIGQRIEMRRVFDNPRPYTLNALYGKKASRNLSVFQAGIAFREYGGGIPAYKYLMPHIKGGERRLKRSEKALQGINVLQGKKFTVQGKSFQRDQYGDITGGQYTRMLAELGVDVNGMAGPAKMKGQRTTGGKKFFVMPQKGGKRGDGNPMAIAERRGKEIVIMLVITGEFTYKPRYDFYGLANRQVHYSLPKHFNRIFNRMMGGGGASVPSFRVAA